MNRFFDIMNTRNLIEGKCKANKDLDVINDVNDNRFTWLTDEFLGYFES